MAIVYLGLGSNLGDRAGYLFRAVEAIDRLERIRCHRVSDFYETEPVGGPPDQRPFINAAAEIETVLNPATLLERLQNVEQDLGRPPPPRQQRWGPRVVDIDVLLYDDLVFSVSGLTVPHPRMHERWFVLRPLVDLAPEVVHPLLHRTMSQLLESSLSVLAS